MAKRRGRADAPRRFETPLRFAAGDAAAPPGEGIAPPQGRVRRSYMMETNLGATLELVPGLDRARVMTEGLLPSGASGFVPAPAPVPFVEAKPGLEMAFNVGQPWTRVADTTGAPWRSICHLSLQFDAGPGTGTGWFVSADTLVTAGHNLLHPSFGWVREIVVTPGKNGAQVDPFGAGYAAAGDVHPEWKASGGNTREADIAYIKINDPSIGMRLGWFGMRVLTDDELAAGALLVHSAGYPSVKPRGTQWVDASRLRGFTPDFLFYRLDTEPGSSGGPIFATFPDGQRLAVASHTHVTAERGSNAGLRITDERFDLIEGWIATRP